MMRPFDDLFGDHTEGKDQKAGYNAGDAGKDNAGENDILQMMLCGFCGFFHTSSERLR